MSDIKVNIGVIGGSGLYNMDEIKNKREIEIYTPFGKPSDNLMYGEISNIPVLFLPRHSRHHTILPSEIPHRANMWALKYFGVKTVISVSAVGSLKEELKPGDFVFPDQFVDETKGRVSTYFGNGIVGHIPLAHPFCMDYSKIMYEKTSKLGITAHFGGIYVCIEGPQFSTKAESQYHRKQGYDIIGMTVATECKIAKEAGLHYMAVSLVTDYDCWKEEDEVSQDKVLETLKKNVDNIKKLLVESIPEISKTVPSCRCEDIMKGAVLTNKKFVSEKILNDLRLIIG
ncbi:MAG: S-methyl-5'-thioadenosine phosphorylase [Elusimicrobiales bacterium]|nr:S-methyl-5'-thioadenosine phosphorylase [Elusimicrobiales bacterium]